MDVPRVARSVSSPTSPCEDVMKNLSLDAIHLCDRE
ncbi:phytanoyl-CoA hydroxylase-interacting protein-like isoform X1, partial [Tachysurus ichikawai]